MTTYYRSRNERRDQKLVRCQSPVGPGRPVWDSVVSRPLFIWLLKKDDPEVVNAAIEATNFNLSFLLYAVVAGLSVIALVGFVLLPAVLITWFALTIVAAVRASDGEDYRYPFTIAFIR